MKYLLPFFLSLLVTAIVACSTSVSQSTQSTNNDQYDFLISLPKESWQSHFPDLDGEVNIFKTNQENSKLQPIVTGLNGFNFILELSPNGDKMLVASYDLSETIDPTLTGSLFVMGLDGTEAVKLSDNFTYYPSPVISGALWLSNDEVAFISGPIGSTYIHTIHTDGHNEVTRTSLNQFNPRLSPFRLLAFQEGKELYWQNGNIGSDTAEISIFPMRSEIDGKNLISLQTIDETALQWGIAPSGNLIAWGKDVITKEFVQVDQLHLDLEPKMFQWSPNGDKLFIQACSENSCSDTISHHIWQPEIINFQDLPINSTSENIIDLSINSKIEWAVWSPDQTQLLVYIPDGGTSTKDHPFQVLNLDTLEMSPVFEGLNLDSISYSYVQWLKNEGKE